MAVVQMLLFQHYFSPLICFLLVDFFFKLMIDLLIILLIVLLIVLFQYCKPLLNSYFILLMITEHKTNKYLICAANVLFSLQFAGQIVPNF